PVLPFALVDFTDRALPIRNTADPFSLFLPNRLFYCLITLIKDIAFSSGDLVFLCTLHFIHLINFI
ncbi:hypothetical protein, partial [Providencia heimbachae]|uniref:hypothetical protein n=1 Tax=Providencia heimbachae TaxID=333962 RepID=UPI001B801082